MNRRDFLKSAGAVSAGLAVLKPGRLFAESAPGTDWRTFEVTTRVEVLKPSGVTLVWLPAALIVETPYQKTFENKYTAEGGIAEMAQNKADGLGIVSARFPEGVPPILTLASRVATRNVAVDLGAPATAPRTDRTELDH